MGKIKIWESIKKGFDILVQNPVILIPAFLIAMLNSFTNIILTNFPEPTETISKEVLVYFISVMIWSCIISLISLFLTSVIIHMTYTAVGRKPSLFESAKIAIFKYPTILISSILYFFIVGFGTLALVIPGIFLFVKFLYYQYAILLDNEGVKSSLKKSWDITHGNWWSTFLINLPFFAILFISGLLSQILGAFMGFIATLIFMPWLLSSLTFAYLQLTDKVQ